MEACLARIAEREPTVRAFAWFDAERRAGRRAAALPGPLHGLPIGVKDVLDTADMPSEYGSPIWPGWRPRADAAAVAWARAAGGVVMGKTVTTEFATRKPGPTTNPAQPGPHARRLQQWLRGGRGGGVLSAGLWHPDRRQRHPAGGVLRRGRLQADASGRSPGSA